MKKVELILFYLLILFLPSQLGKHFWPEFAIIMGIRVDYLSPTIYFTDILIRLLFTVWLYRKLKKAELPGITRGGIIYCLFLLMLALQIIVSGNVLNGWYHFMKFLEFSFVAYYVTKSAFVSLMKISFVLATGVIFESVLAITQYLHHGSLGGVLYFFGERTFTAATPGIANASIAGELVLRPYGTFPHPNVLAGYLLISMFFLFFFLYKNKYKGFAAFSLFLGSSALLLTLSRIAIILWILFIAGVVVWQIKKSLQQKKKETAYLLGASLLILTAGWFLFAPTLIPRFAETTFTEEAAVQRAELIKASTEIIWAHPYFGVGLGNFLPVLSTLRSPLSLGLYLQPVHNIFLLIAAETGLIGLAFVCWFLVKTYRRLFSRMRFENSFRESLGLCIALTSMLILGMFDHYFLTLQQGQLLLALVLGACFTSGKKPFHLRKAKISRTSQVGLT